MYKESIRQTLKHTNIEKAANDYISLAAFL